MRCPKERTLVLCSEGKEVQLFDLMAQLILERAQDGTLSKVTAMELLNHIEWLYLKLHEYVSEEGW